MTIPAPSRSLPRQVHGDRAARATERTVPEEVAVALTYNRHAYATMMASPQDLEDFAVGFSLSEGIITRPGEILELETVVVADGIELRMTITPERMSAFTRRRRHMAGPTGCGLCGIEAIAEAMRAPRPMTATLTVTVAEVARMIADLSAWQPLNRLTHAVHAAGYWVPDRGFIAVREDVGRHNALDKLAGALARQGTTDPGGVVLTSRVSVEMVQKTAAIGAPIIVAVSAPTALAVRVAEAAGITLAAIARDDGFEIFSHPERIHQDTF